MHGMLNVQARPHHEHCDRASAKIQSQKADIVRRPEMLGCLHICTASDVVSECSGSTTRCGCRLLEHAQGAASADAEKISNVQMQQNIVLQQSAPMETTHRAAQIHPHPHGLLPTPPALSNTSCATSRARLSAASCVSASAYTRTASSVPDGRAKARPWGNLATAASMASCNPAAGRGHTVQALGAQCYPEQ